MRKIICLCITGILLLPGCGKSAQAGTGTAEETALKDNQEVVYGQIETIVGNDMTIALAEAEETEVQGKSPAQMTEEPTSADGESQFPGRDSMPDMWEIPSPGEMPGEVQNGGTLKDSQGDANIQNEEDARKNEDTEETKLVTTYTLTGEKKDMRIPVGTTVTTSLGTATTFSRLAAGDMVKLVVQKEEDSKEVIVGIWIVG